MTPHPLILLSAVQALASPLPPVAPPERVEREAWAMGTRVRIVAEATTRPAALGATEAALLELERQERLLSTWDPASELSRLNHADPAERPSVSTELTGLLKEVEDWSATTGRAFEPRVGALIDAWDLRGAGRTPSLLEVRRAIREGGWIDSGAFGKGAALRAIAASLEEHGVTRILVDLGGQLWAASRDGTPWSIDVAHPADRHRPIARLRVTDVSVATSGASERWVEVDGRRLGHIVDPRSGRPVPDWGSVTVVSTDPLSADILATALYVMGPEQGMEWAIEHTEADVLFARVGGEDLQLTWTPGMERWLQSDERKTDR